MVSKERIKRACRLAIANIIQESTTDVDLYNYPFEIGFLKDKEFSEKLTEYISNAIHNNNFSLLKVHKLGHVLIPKKSLSDYRKCAWVDVYDEIVYLTLVLIIVTEIERMRISKDKNRVFSYRHKKKNGQIFDEKYNFTAFRNHTQKKSYYKHNKVMVECDVSNFYDRLNIHRIESILRSNPQIDDDIISLINELLLFWANRDSYGLPVGSNASRILAEVSLIEVDNYLLSKGVNFCRFVDDFRLFARDAFTAHSHLALLTSCLSREGIFLNTQKTKIKDISQLTSKKSNKDNSDQNFDDSDDKGINVDPVSRNETINAEIENNRLNKSKIIRGYSGLIPTKFRELSKNEIHNLKNNDLTEMLKKAESILLIDPKEFVILIKTIVAKEEFTQLGRIPKILLKFPQFIPYFVDVLLKKHKSIEQKTINEIQNEFRDWLGKEDTPEYIQVYLVRLYSSNLFENKEILLNTFRDLKRNSGDYIGRALLEALEGKLTRGEMLEIREYYYRADLWEKRQILKLIDSKLSFGEKRPFLKDVELHEEDLFIKYMIRKSKKNRK